MAEANAVTPPLQTAAATQEKAKLRKVLGRIDLVLFTACAILEANRSTGPWRHGGCLGAACSLQPPVGEAEPR
jgi:hypothetical protein